LHEADAAGVLFFARYLMFAHDADEEFMAAHGIDFAHVIREGAYVLPVVHAESDHRRPLWAGETATITVRVQEVKRRSFTLAYELRTPSGSLAAECRTTHAAVNKGTGRACPLPPEVLSVLRGSCLT
jgi:YbgC/YbaW family acyl-CoA thioester hydrolase